MNRKFCVVDAEGSRDALLGVAFRSDEYVGYLTDHVAIREQILAHARGGYTFVAHNAAYDLPVIFWTLDIPMRAIYYESHFNRGQWRYDPKRPMAEMWDSFNLSGNLSLAALGEAIGLPKLETPASLTGEDISRYRWKCEKHEVWECVECYAVRDAEIVYRYLQTLETTMSGWGLKLSARIAANAQAVWRALDQPTPIKLQDSKCRRLGRAAYFGGRVETFMLGHLAPIWTADVVSMYPSVMRDGLFPCPDHMVWVAGIRPDQLPLEHEGAAECTVYVPPCHVPPLPNSRKGERIFATGAQRGTWMLSELRHALTQGCRILAVHQACWSTVSLSPFSTFVNGLWELRAEYKRVGDPRAQTIKVLLNSAYGRLGLRAGLRQDVIEPWDPRLTMEDYARKATSKPRKRDYSRNGSEWPDTGVRMELIGGKPFVRYGRGVPYEHEWVNVLWAAQITALARIKLHRYLIMQGESIVYCDTDSVFSTAPIAGLGEGLGELSDPISYAEGWIVGPKLYSLTRYDHQLREDGSCSLCGMDPKEALGRPCRIARAKGVPRSYALDFLQGKEVIFDSPVSARKQRHGGPQAGEWIEIHRERQLVPHRRTPLNPALLETGFGFSRTLPPHYGSG